VSLINGKYKKETNFSIVPDSTNIWMGELPFKSGSKFPTEPIQTRADIFNTNDLLYENSIDDIYGQYLQVLPETNVLSGFMLRELVCRLPYHRNNVENWVGVICSILPSIEFDLNENIEQQLSKIVNNSNIKTIITDEIRSRFLYGFSCYKLSKYGEKVIIDTIPSKNVVLFANKEHIGEIEVVVVFNIYKSDKGSDICEFIEYHNSGLVRKRCFNYSNGILGREIVELREEGKAFENLDVSPIVVFRHNNINSNDIFGCDTFRFWDSSIVGAMRALQNLFRVGENVREIIRKVPESALSKDNVSGVTTFMNRGTISYNENTDNNIDIKYVQPDMAMIEAAIKVFETAMKSVSIDAGLGSVFFDIEKAGSNLSAKSIEAMLYPTRLRSNLIKEETNEGLIDLVKKIILVGAGLIVDRSSIQIRWFNTFPHDVKEYTDAIMSRVVAEKPTLSVVDAITLLDNVSNYTAAKKAKELEQSVNKLNLLTSSKNDGQENVIVDEKIESSNNGVDSMTIGEREVTSSDSDIHNTNEGDNIDDNQLLWETQRLPL